MEMTATVVWIAYIKNKIIYDSNSQLLLFLWMHPIRHFDS